MAESSNLSSRESEILVLVAKGASNKEIARELHISTNTVKVHMRNIFTKVGANSRTEAAMYAVNTGLVEVDSQEKISVDEAGQRRSNRLLFAGLGIFVLVLIIAVVAIAVVQRGNNNNQAFANQPIIEEGQRWQEKAPMSEARKGLALAAYAGQVFAIGGETEQGTTGRVERYDPNLDEWMDLKDKPIAVTDVSAGVIGGKIYVPGGRAESDLINQTLEIYSPGEDSWESGADLPQALSAYGLVSYEGYLYLFGGWDGTNVQNSVYRYDPESDAWEQLSSMPTGRAYPGVSIINEKIYIIGGFDGVQAVGDIEVFSPAVEGSGESSWEIETPLSEPRYASGVVSLAGTTYAIGGIGVEDGVLAHLGRPDESSDWSEFTNLLNVPYSHFGVIPVGTYLYIIGGELDGEITNQNLAYQAIYSINLPVIRD